MRELKYLGVFLLVLNTSQGEAFVTVGLGPDCDFNNLFTAYQSNEVELRVTSEQVYANSFTIDKIKSIRGGFDNCLSAQANIVGDEKSKWSGLNGFNNTVIEINADLLIPVTVIIENFEVFDGNNSTASGAGGIKISGNTGLIIRDSIIYDNTGNEGAGIHVFGEDARLTLENTVVRNNTATGFGGGIYCSNGAKLNIDATSTIHDNSATFSGGGLFGGFGCQVTNASGQEVVGRNRNGVSFNQANKGGGIFLQTGAQMDLIGSYFHPATINNNSADEPAQLSGGGLYLAGEDTFAQLFNVFVNANDSVNHGAALVVTDGATMVMKQATSGCDYGNSDVCSQIKNNQASSLQAEGAAGYFREGANVKIAQTDVDRNLSNEVSTFAIYDQTHVRLEGNLIRNNGGPGQDSTTLFFISGGANQASQLDFVYNTVVNNTVTHFFTANNINSSQVVNVFNSIIWDFGQIFNFNGPATSQIDCSVVHESASLSGNVGAILTNDPLLVNEATADYRLSLASDAIDFCDNNLFPAENNDLNNLTRGFDVPAVNNALGVYDAGAYEYHPPFIFKNGFE